MNPTVPQAYDRLGISREAVLQAPRITPQIGKIGKMLESFNLHLPRDPYYYLAASDHADARAILDARASIPRVYAKLLPIEAFCVAASVPTTRVPEMIVLAAMRMGVQASSMIAAMAHPSVVKKTIDMALTDGGVDDRQTLHKATGFLPTPRGAQTNINIPIHASSSASAASEARALNVAAPPVESAIKRLSERLNLKRARVQSQPALPASTATELDRDRELELVPIAVNDRVIDRVIEIESELESESESGEEEADDLD